MIKKTLLLLITFVSCSLWAVGDGHHGSITDLIFPLVNFLIFSGVLIWLVKPKLKTAFTHAHEDVQEFMERANKKAQESAVMLAEQEGRLENLDSEIEKLFKNVDKQIENFEKNYETETVEKIAKLEEDATRKIETERKMQINKISNELLDQVINQAKNSIKKNGQQEEVAQKLVGEFQL